MVRGRWFACGANRVFVPTHGVPLVVVVLRLAEAGWAHGDLSPYNLLVDDGRLVAIDWPQIVDVIGNPQGFEFLERDATTMVTWFRRKGLDVDAGELVADLVAEATTRF